MLQAMLQAGERIIKLLQYDLKAANRFVALPTDEAMFCGAVASGHSSLKEQPSGSQANGADVDT
jgi:hypothetical protein